MSVVERTLIIQFTNRRRQEKFVEIVKISPDIHKWLLEVVENLVIFRFECKDTRDHMMEVLKQTVPKYKIMLHNGQEQMKIL